jgi:hypothetical protein
VSIPVIFMINPYTISSGIKSFEESCI